MMLCSQSIPNSTLIWMPPSECSDASQVSHVKSKVFLEFDFHLILQIAWLLQTGIHYWTSPRFAENAMPEGCVDEMEWHRRLNPELWHGTWCSKEEMSKENQWAASFLPSSSVGFRTLWLPLQGAWSNSQSCTDHLTVQNKQSGFEVIRVPLPVFISPSEKREGLCQDRKKKIKSV